MNNENIIMDYALNLIREFKRMAIKQRINRLDEEIMHVSRIMVRYYDDPDQYNKAVTLENMLDYCRVYKSDPLPLLNTMIHIFNWRA
jgi:hypothetical protein